MVVKLPWMRFDPPAHTLLKSGSPNQGSIAGYGVECQICMIDQRSIPAETPAVVHAKMPVSRCRPGMTRDGCVHHPPTVLGIRQEAS